MVPPVPMNMPTPRRNSSNRVTGGAAGCAGAWANETFRDKATPARPAVEEDRNCLRFMESSRTRNSILDWLLAATLAIAVISGLAGIDFEIGGVSFRSHSVWRVLVLSAIVVVIRRWMGIDSWPRWLTRVALLAAICGSAGTWLRFLLTTIGEIG